MTTKAAVRRETTRLPSHMLMRSTAECLPRAEAGTAGAAISGAIAGRTTAAGLVTGIAITAGAIAGEATTAERISPDIIASAAPEEARSASGAGFVVWSISSG